MSFSIRKATPEDAPALADIHVRARRESMPYLPDIHSPAVGHFDSNTPRNQPGSRPQRGKVAPLGRSHASGRLMCPGRPPSRRRNP